jgi:hypothetical protein
MRQDTVVRMTDRVAWARMLQEAAGSRAEQPDRICQLCVDMLGVSGAGITMVGGDAGHRAVVSSTDAIAARIEDLQITLGEGPCIDAAGSGRPVLVADISEPGDVLIERWPAFMSAVADEGVRAVFAFPLRIGAIGLGAMDMYRTDPGPLTDDQLAGALLAADAAALSLLDLRPKGRDDSYLDPRPGPSHQPQVHQATGMIKVQLGVSVDNAFLMLRARAFTTSRPLHEVATDVVERRLRFTEEDE